MSSLQFLYKQVIRMFPSKANVISTKTSQIHLLPNKVHVFLFRVITNSMSAMYEHQRF